MAKHYTEEYISSYLEGFGEQAPISLKSCLKSKDTLWQPVLQTTIYSNRNGKKHILTGTRKESTNPTHPNVVSTPTSLIPKEVALALYQNFFSLSDIDNKIYFNELNVDDLQLLYKFPKDQRKWNIPDTSNLLPFVVANILARKLGLGSELEFATTKKYIASCHLSMIAAGFCYAADSKPDDDNFKTPLFEPLLMFGVTVELTQGIKIPDNTDSYDNLSWSTINDYQDGVRTKELKYFNKKFLDSSFQNKSNKVKVCVRGLCLQTANIIIDSK